MRYDLQLRPRVIPNRQAMARYFASRHHYCFCDSEAYYDNQNTEVYFSFSIETRTVQFHLDYIRPHVFALEAVTELEAFSKAFSCVVGKGGDSALSAPFSTERFLRDWLLGNAYKYQSDGIMGREGVHLIVDSRGIEAVWRWNASRTEIQKYYASLLEVAFVPVVRWGMDQGNGQPMRYAVWSAGVWIALPALATHVVLARRKFGLPDTLIPIDEIASWQGMVWEDAPAGRVLRSPIDEYGRWLWERQFCAAPYISAEEVMHKTPQDHVHDGDFVAMRKPQPALLKRA
jgi:hypothetical protein